MTLNELIEHAGKAIESIGVAAIVVGVVVTTFTFLTKIVSDRGADHYTTYRKRLGRSILIGLEFLVAGDIVRTVAVAPSFSNVGVLAVIVLVRTFLSLSLEVEIEGRLPWRRGSASNDDAVS